MRPKGSVFHAAGAPMLGPLRLKNPDDEALAQGKTHNLAFAAHDHNITTRGHHISFPTTVAFGAKAEVHATRLK